MKSAEKPIKKKTSIKSNLHCGACQEIFYEIDDLKKHLEICPAAKAMLPMVDMTFFLDQDPTGHPMSHFIMNLNRSASLIKRYAYSVADQLDQFTRSKIHRELCDKLKIEYNDFAPFESSNIITVPTRYEAECILWNEIIKHFNKIKPRIRKNMTKDG